MRKLEFLFLLIVSFIATGLFVTPSASVGSAHIEIVVTDALHGRPLGGAMVILYDRSIVLYDGKNTITQTTGINGRCSFDALGDKWYDILVFIDDPSTPGRDYVPSVLTTYLQEGATVTHEFRLSPGATILATEDAYFVNVSRSGSHFLFMVIDRATDEPISLSNSLANYGHGFPRWSGAPWRGENWQAKILGLKPNEIIVPANVSVSIRVRTLVFVDTVYGLEFEMDNDGNCYNLTWGDLVQESLSKYSLRQNFIIGERFLSSTSELVSEASATGFYVAAESRELTRAGTLIQTAREFYREKDYPLAHSYLREAYIAVANVDNQMKDLFSTASLTSMVAPIFLSAMALTLGLFFFEDARRRFIAGLAILMVFLTIFYFLFPGAKIAGVLPVWGISAFSLVLLNLVTPKLFSPSGERREFYVEEPPLRTLVWSIFSLAKRNLKRRKLRTTLSLVNLSVLAFSFIIFTSVSVGLGLLYEPERERTAPREGVLIRNFGSLMNPELPLPLSLVDWLSRRPEVQAAVPKAESTPQFTSLADLVARDEKRILINGVLGICPFLEKNVTRIQDEVVSGIFLEDNMTNAIMISQKAADNLGVKVGDHLSFYDSVFELVGILSDEGIGGVVDLDGSSVLPQKLVMSSGGPIATVCSSDEVVVTTFNTTLMLPNTMISSIGVLLKDDRDILAFSRLVVFNQGYSVWAATDKGVFYVKIGTGIESAGFAVVFFLLVLVILSVALHFVATTYERKREIFSMSSLGLNPTHVTLTLMAEAIVIGVVGGGLGYLAGLNSYKLLTYLPADLIVRQKTSIEWSLFTLLFTAITAVLASVFPARNASTIATPSLQHRWSVRAQGSRQADGTWIFTMPFKVPEVNVDLFMVFLENRLKDRVGRLKDGVESIRLRSEDRLGHTMKTVQFRYVSGETEGNGFTVDNEINLVKEKDAKEYSIVLKSRLVSLDMAEEVRIHESISFLRQLLLQWTTLDSHSNSPK